LEDYANEKIITLFFIILSLLFLCSCKDIISDRQSSQNKNTDLMTSELDNELWETYYYVDEFKQPTSKKYIVNNKLFNGTFNNSATTDFELCVQVLVDNCNITIKLFEYGNLQVKSNYNKDYSIKMRREDVSEYYLKGILYSDKIYVSYMHTIPINERDDNLIDKDQQAIIDALLEDKTVSFYVVDKDYSTSTYLFTIETENFESEYEKLFDSSIN